MGVSKFFTPSLDNISQVTTLVLEFHIITHSGVYFGRSLIISEGFLAAVLTDDCAAGRTDAFIFSDVGSVVISDWASSIDARYVLEQPRLAAAPQSSTGMPANNLRGAYAFPPSALIFLSPHHRPLVYALAR